MALLDKVADVFKSQAKNVLQAGKDTTHSAVFKTAMNAFIKNYGKVVSFKIDSKDKSLVFEVMLIGELQPVRIEIEKYDFITEGEITYAIVHRLKANRYWMDAMMEFALLGKKIPLPKEMTKPIQLIM